MQYYVRTDDGQRYGPADLPTLNRWIQEGRLAPHQMVEDAVSGQTMPASQVLGLVFPNAAGRPPGMSAPGPMESNYARPGMPGLGAVPVELQGGFNFGAFWFTWVWGLNHKKPITLVALVLGIIPYIGSLAAIGFAIWVGLNGNRWAWESGRFTSVQDCLNCQRIWRNWAIAFLAVTCVAGIIAVSVVGLAGLTER